MTHARTLTTPLLAAIVVASLALAFAIPASAATRNRCGTITTPIGKKLPLEASRASCATARAVIRRYYRVIRRGCTTNRCFKTVKGYRCGTATVGLEQQTGVSTTCTRGRAGHRRTIRTLSKR